MTSADEMRAALTAVLAEVPELDAEFVADRILPTVRGIVAGAAVAGYRTGVADAERGVYVPGSEALAAAEQRGYERALEDPT